MPKYIIDADVFVYKLAYLNDNETKSDCYVNTIKYIESQLRQINALDNYILFLGGKGNFRYDIDPSYKNKRQKPKWQHFNYIKYDIIPNNFNVKVVNNVEVDDVIASYTYKYKDVIIVHIDKDLLQIPGLHIYRGHNRIVSDAEAYLFLMTQVLTGDPVDGIKGVPGIGIKTAEKLLNNIPSVNILDIVINEYNKKYNDNGLIEFYKNYNLIKLKHNVNVEFD